MHLSRETVVNGGEPAAHPNVTESCVHSDGYVHQVESLIENTLSPKMAERLKRLDEKIEKLKQHCTQSADESELQEVLRDINRRRRAFDSKTFFMVTFGMLKAGKSTLVNTFVGKEVSPVGRAKETTLRSSIVMASDSANREGIYLYSPKKNASSNTDKDVFNWQKNNGMRLMDFLNGLITKEEFLSEFKVDYLPFSKTDLERILTSSNVPEHPNILAPVIRVDAATTNQEVGSANLLKDGVAILDTPGLDGAKANKDIDPFWKSLMSYGDYFMLVQSSMSAINKDCREMIATLYRETKNAPILIVFNEIASNFWLLPEVEKKKLKDDAQTASQNLAEQLRMELGGKIPEYVRINAGEASDAVFGTPNDNCKDNSEMIEESRVRDLRNRIVRTLREDRMIIKERNAAGRMVTVLEESLKKIDDCVTNLENKKNEETDRREKRWQKSENAAAEVVNSFVIAMDDCLGSKIAKRFADTMKLHMESDFKVDIQNPYDKKHEKENGKFEVNHKVLQGDTERKKQQDAIDKVVKEFEDKFKRNFFQNDLCLAHEPWKTASEKISEEKEKLCHLVHEIGEVSDKDTIFKKSFFEKLFQDLHVDHILKTMEGKCKLDQEPIKAVPWWRGNIPCNPYKVYESECYEAFDRLIKKKSWVKKIEGKVAILSDVKKILTEMKEIIAEV